MAKISKEKKNMRQSFFGRKFPCQFCDRTDYHSHALLDSENKVVKKISPNATEA